MPAVVFYISGHGFGHASRGIEVLNTLGRRAPSVRLIVCTSAPRWLFDLTMRVPFELRGLEADTGLVQPDSLTHDLETSLRRAADFYRNFGERVASEASFLESVRRDSRGRLRLWPSRLWPGRPWRGPLRSAIVIGDIPPLAFAAAARAGIPSYALGNFTWDWIYEDYPEHESLAPGMVATVKRAYASATAAWRLPMHGGFETFRAVEDVPFVARHSARGRSEVRRALGLPPDRPLVLSSFGGFGLGGLPLDRLDCLDRYGVVVTGTGARPAIEAPASTMIFRLQEDEIYGRGFRYEDLVGSVDVVLSKPGFGIIAECLANDTALVYTSRGHFREYDVLVREMPRFLRCRFIPREDLLAGRWRAALDHVLEQPPPPRRPRTDGAELVAERVLRALTED